MKKDQDLVSRREKRGLVYVYIPLSITIALSSGVPADCLYPSD